ncbi:YqaA family protein [Vibrio viridaestus]|uniref:DedA family protein n=1 Tax=Vibrio viridaestus TaxID=2487322 RepID=A0A3N9THG2_9VIBR|nr:YqaA family protein [Vibrio viridaestus]RQW62935.1 DedA family protein [Vibrio viridaestus]
MLEWVTTFISNLGSLWADSALLMLFITGFLSATLLPGGSEAVLFATLDLHQFSPLLAITVATLGNTLGGATNYALGLWIPNRTEGRKRGLKSLLWLQKYGYWALLFSWLPVIGDAMCVAAGWLRMKFWPSLILIFIGKAIRYAVLTALFYGFF